MVEGDVCRVSAVQIGEAVQAGESVAEVNGQPFLGAAPAAGRLVFRAGFFSFGSGCFCFHRFSLSLSLLYHLGICRQAKSAKIPKISENNFGRRSPLSVLRFDDSVTLAHFPPAGIRNLSYLRQFGPPGLRLLRSGGPP